MPRLRRPFSALYSASTFGGTLFQPFIDQFDIYVISLRYHTEELE
jgi:hypothetical protein